MNRRDEVRRIRERLLRLCSPRAQMILIVALTGGAGWLASLGFRHAGLVGMTQRYALSVLAAYVVFLILLRLWVWLHDKDVVDSANVPTDDSASSPNCRASNARTNAHESDDSLSDLIPDSFPDIDEAGILLLAIAAIGIVAVGALWAVWMAPTLLAELVLDVTLASGLYRRLSRIESRYWLSTAIRKTASPFAITFVVVVAAGAFLQSVAPNATSFGEALSIIANR